MNTDAAVTRTGGMVAETCAVPGAPSIGCWRIDPSLAQGDNAFAVPGFGPTPISAPFYDYVLGTTEYRVWLSADTGYPVNISAALTVGGNARTGLVWFTTAQLCDTVTRTGTCGPQLFLRNSLTSGVADASYTFIAPRTGTTLMCDWDGNGTDTPGVFVGGTWYVTNSTVGGSAQMVFGYGQSRGHPGVRRLGRQRHRHARHRAQRGVVPDQHPGQSVRRRALRLRRGPGRHPGGG